MRGIIPFGTRRSALSNPRDDFFSIFDDLVGESFTRHMRDTFKLDVRDSGDEYVIDADMPGVAREDIAIDLNEGQLTITLTQREETAEEASGYIHRERGYRQTSRGVYLPDANASAIKARLQDGVLKITVPKEAKVDKSRKIDIE